MRSRNWFALAVAAVLVAPFLMAAVPEAKGDDPHPQAILEVIKYVRSALAEKGDEGVVALARIAKADILKKMGKADLAIAELKKLAEESKDREILVVANAALLDLLSKERRFDEGIALMDGLIAKARGSSR